jgi:hypothetical protein
MSTIMKSREITFIVTLTTAVSLLGSSGCDGATRFPQSADGKWEAVRVRDEEGGFNFQVKEVEGGKVVLTTSPKYSSPNDVKAGNFSPDSTKFAACYHYSGNYTWVGVWSLKTGKQLGETELSGFVTNIPDSVFKVKDDEQKSEASGKQSETTSIFPFSPNGKYEAVRISDERSGVHFQVKEVDGGRVILTTTAQYVTPNDVKAGKFSADSTKIAAAYHYGGPYTWIGVWSLKTGDLIGAVIVKDWVATIPDTAFLGKKSE